MNIVGMSDYLIYFDNVRVDPYVLNWSVRNGLFASDCAGSVTLFSSDPLKNWKAYLCQVRIFAKNVFTGKYVHIFTGDILDRSNEDRRSDSGVITYTIKGLYHWLDVPIPIMVNSQERFDAIQRIEYLARNINYDEVQSFFNNQADANFKDKSIQEMIIFLFEMMSKGYYEIGQSNSSFGWIDIQNRLRVCGEVLETFRKSGFLDRFTLVNSTRINSFYTYLVEFLTKLMFEFYQDRDGNFNIKAPSWNDDILMHHVLDESIVVKSSGNDQWSVEPTRILVKGGTTEEMKAIGGGDPTLNASARPVGIWIGDPEKGEFHSIRYSYEEEALGLGYQELLDAETVATGEWHDEISQYRVSSPFGQRARGNHKGTDFATPQGTPIKSLCAGKVTYSGVYKDGNSCVEIDSGTYMYRYIHLSKLIASQGQTVRAGQVIGLSGGTPGTFGSGTSSGAHLHLDIRPHGAPLSKCFDPVPFLKKQKEQAIKTSQQGGKNAYGTTQDYAGLYEKVAKLNPGAIGKSLGLNEETTIALAMKLYTGNVSTVKTTATKKKLYGLFSTPEFMVGNLAEKIKAPNGGGTLSLQLTIAGFARVNEKNSGLKECVTAFVKAGDYGNADSFYWELNDMIDWLNNRKKQAESPPTSRATPYAGKDQTTPKATVPTVSNSSLIGSTNPFIVLATAYSPSPDENGGYSTTKTGHKLNAATKIIAVDPTVIPLNSVVEIKSDYPGVSGYYNAYDTGGGIKGARIDILFPDKASCEKFGRKKVEVRIVKNGKTGYEMIGPPPPKAKAIAYNSKSTQKLAAYIPKAGDPYKALIATRPNGVDANIIAAIIQNTSKWNQYFEDATRAGLMGVPKKYFEAQKIPTDVWYTPGESIQYGTKFFKACFDALGKVSLALAAYYAADIKAVQLITKNSNSSNYMQIAENLEKSFPGQRAFVESVSKQYAATFQADYIEGDPVSVDQGYTVSQDPMKRDVEMQKYALSKEEQRFKMNLHIYEQELIRYDLMQGAPMSADEAIMRYAKYMMYIGRAQAHVKQVNLSLCLPHLRPGFNVWIEPTRDNLVAYVTGYTHSGSFNSGCFTSIQTGFVREAQFYDAVDSNVFISTPNITAEDFGKTIARAEMAGWIEKLSAMHKNTQVAQQATEAEALVSLYNAANAKVSDKIGNKWNEEFTKEEIDTLIQEEYKSAPPIVQERCNEIAKVMKDSEPFFIRALLKNEAR